MSNSNLFLKSGFLRVPLQNGLGRHVCQLQRITLKFCKNLGSSKGMRDYIQHDTVDTASRNPGVVVYLKPRRHRDPVIVAEYLNGERQWLHCRNMSREEISRFVDLMVGCSDAADVRYRKPWSTSSPSVQGPWTPFNMYPHKSATQKDSVAYTKLLELAKQQRLINTDTQQ